MNKDTVFKFLEEYEGDSYFKQVGIIMYTYDCDYQTASQLVIAWINR